MAYPAQLSSQHLIADCYTLQHISAEGHTLWREAYYDYPTYFYIHGDQAASTWKTHQKKLSQCSPPTRQTHNA